MTPIIKPQELAQLKKKQLVFIDARVGADASEKYRALHLKGAILVNLENDLSKIKKDPKNGGRHPLPEVIEFSKTLGRLGIDRQSHVIIYDDKNGSNAAARFWWMLRSAGHDKVQVLDGGLAAALAAGLPTSSGDEAAEAKPPYEFHTWQLPTADIEEVARVAENPDFLVIDVRDAYRFLGESEPIDLIAGHIPGAINVPFSENLEANGFYLSPDELRTKYSKLIAHRPQDHVIIHCGSGVTACHTLLAMAYAGMAIPKLYVGSWSEWSRNDRPMVAKQSYAPRD